MTRRTKIDCDMSAFRRSFVIVTAIHEWYSNHNTHPPSFPDRSRPAMPIQVDCPNCRKAYKLSSKLAGKRVRCQACQTTFPVPAGAGVNGEAGAAPDRTAAVQATPKAVVAEAFPEVLPAERDEDAPRPATKSNTWMYLLIGGGVAALLACCVAPAGIFGVLLWLAPTSNSPVAVNPTPSIGPDPRPPVDSNPKAPADPDPKPPIDRNPKPPIDTQPEPDDNPTGPKLDADPPREPTPALADPHGVIALAAGGNDSGRFLWGPGPLVAVESRKKNETTWEVWNLQTMKQLGSAPNAFGEDVRLSTDGGYLAVLKHPGGSFKSSGVEIYTVADGKLLRKLPAMNGEDDRIGITAFAGPGQFLSLQNKGLGGSAKVWDVKTGEQVAAFETVGIVQRTSDAASPGGRYLAMFNSSDLKHPIEVYELATGKVVRTIRPKLPKDVYSNCRSLTFSPDGKELAALLDCGGTDYLEAWDFETGKRTAYHAFPGSLTKTAKSSNPGLLGAYPAPLECVPDRSGWFAYGQLMIDHDRGNVFWTLPPEDPNVVFERRFLDADHLVTVTSKSRRERQLEIITLPKEEIAAARKK
jgi:predicted Zn finger-like uncharacterized protein